MHKTQVKIAIHQKKMQTKNKNKYLDFNCNSKNELKSNKHEEKHNDNEERDRQREKKKVGREERYLRKIKIN